MEPSTRLDGNEVRYDHDMNDMNESTYTLGLNRGTTPMGSDSDREIGEPQEWHG